MKDVVILSAARTPTGAYQGGLESVAAPKIGAVAIEAAVSRASIPKESVEQCVMGCVLSGGLGQAPARQAALFGGLPHSVCCTTVNRVCGSGLKAVMMAAQAIQTDEASVVVAGGMENMSRAPHALEKARFGYRMGHGRLLDLMVHDGLWDVYNEYHMGSAGELCAKEYKFTREEQDRYAKESYKKALHAVEAGLFKEELVPVPVSTKKGTELFTTDEEPFKAKMDKFGELKPAFDKNGTITAANASSLSDGAAALVVASAEWAQKRGSKPLARIIGFASHAQAPEWFTTAPVGAVKKLLEKTKLSIGEIDLFEINEAFAVVPMAAIRDLKIPENKVNIHGGAIALGHPLGASGAKILTTLVHALRREKKRYGIATLCIGGGEGSALLVEAL